MMISAHGEKSVHSTGEFKAVRLNAVFAAALPAELPAEPK
jgi:hypothetical protein